ncbi:tripartite tricarboxylate transporter permease [Phreatobacter aquaticus]|uniref:Tripartite tricarboxylate transporter permease n=1 Tax=Phreatobacter aquaticus TaxID=2570229 RepID=A0A4D7QP45_9HYPH|nr:tripartite tricarboxylate transporter permease [Phreatobacter aquaticus]QCK87359.1 tripartite tricarboxylate transporter permease [Phreatobacter aquaticus]
MDLVSNIALGFSVAITPVNILFCFVGVLLGTLIGVLPGIGAVATMSMLLPVTFHLPPATSLIMLAGIYYGAQYGGSTTAILVKLPGEASSVATVLDGYAMAQKGRAGAALSIAALASFVAGSLATLLIAIAGPLMAQLALRFGPAEYFSLMLLGLVASVILASGSVVKAIVMILVGVYLGLVGPDANSPMPRLTFGVPALAEGVNFVALAVGLFGISEIILNLEGHLARVAPVAMRDLFPNRDELRRSVGPTLRGTAIGSILGVLPGGGALLASFGAYAIEKKLSSEPERFGQGAVEGVAAPEAANNAGAQTSFVPLLTLGVPSNAIMAVMAGAMTIQGIAPSPKVMTEHATLFWGMIASMWIGNFLLVILNLPLVGLWVKLLQVPYRLLYPAILFFCCIGVYSINNSAFDVYLAVGFGIIGYLMIKLGFEPTPLLLGFILGPMMEENLKRALILSGGSLEPFYQRPISLTLLVLTVGMFVLMALPSFKRTRETALNAD